MNIPEPTVRKVGENDRLFCPVPECENTYATQKGYANRAGYERHELTHLESETVGFMSRLDWGSPGFRRGAIMKAFRRFEKEKVKFIALVGGLVSFPHLRGMMNAGFLRVFWEENYGGEYGKGEKKPPVKERNAQAREAILQSWADQIAKEIPQLHNRSGNLVKIYIVTSPAPNYDGWIGREVARRLTVVRPDIRYWGEKSVRLPLKRQNKVLGLLAPAKASWRSKYYSTAVDRLIEDEEKQTSQPLPDFWVVGCPAASLQRPRGEKKRPYISVPALHRLKEVHTAENQIGIRVMEFLPQGGFLVRTYNFKDDIANERRWIPEPEGTPLQKAIVAALKEQGAMTPGMLEDHLRVSRDEIAKEIEALNLGGYKPAVILDEDSQLFEFDGDWITRELSYPDIPEQEYQEDTLLNFGCLHGGSVYTEYEFFVHQVPQLILQRGSTILVGAGDLVQGLEHNLDRRGEVIPGFNNYTRQEMLSAELVCRVMLKVFEVRLGKALKAFRDRAPSEEELRAVVEEALMKFLYREGNHDAWVLKDGHTPLSSFEPALVSCLARGMGEILAQKELLLPNLLGIAKAHVGYGETHRLPSGLGITILHPSMARALTSSLRAQQMLEQAKTPVVVGANFHIAVNVEQWDSDFGQRVAQQVGSIVWKTDFEHGRLKTLDVGVGHLRIVSHRGRILLTETAFSGEGTKQETHSNDLVLWGFLRNFDS